MLYNEIGVEKFLTATRAALVEDFMSSCSDFIVVERSLVPVSREGKLHAYFLIKAGMSTQRAFEILREKKYAGEIGYYGLKDSNSLSVQRIVLSKSLGDSFCLNGKALLKYIGKTSFFPRRGGFDGNIFAIRLPGSEQSLSTLKELQRTSHFPNFFGHQRFGTRKPLNHEIAIDLLQKGKLDPRRSWKHRIIAESLQAFIFNRCLSRLRDSSNLSRFGLLIGKEFEKYERREGVSGEHFICALREAESLGILEAISKMSFPKAQLRQLYIQNPLTRYYSLNGKIFAVLKMPPGSYASLVIREIFKENEDWIFRKCSFPRICS
ncbi:MAG: tRNA pseudouridine(13) synthase TruD [Fervidicoccaceae archaeon]